MKDTLYTQKFNKIPILISKYTDDKNKGWRAEIPDNHEEYKPSFLKEINFEDINFHFRHDIEVHESDHLIFKAKKNAILAANYINKQYLKGRGKLWFW